MLELRQIQAELDDVHKWLWNNPPDGINRKERRRQMERIQKVCEELSASTYLDYMAAWENSDSTADQLETTHPALYYLRKATLHAMQDIRQTTVTQGVAVWYLYNMGYVFKTPDTCFGIDLHLRDAETLADELDFLLITHSHRDHYTESLLNAMIAVNKPVITRWYPGSTIVKRPEEFRFGDVRVKIDLGDHRLFFPLNNMLMFQVDCGKSANYCTIYHSGDGSRIKKMQPDKPVDIFILHVQLFMMSVEGAIKHIKPCIAFVSHTLELSHSPKLPLRWSFDYAFKKINNIPETEATVLTWGERWLLPGTVLHRPKSRL